MMEEVPKILAISNYVPEEIFDVRRFVGYRSSVHLNSYCSYSGDFIGQVLEDPNIDGAIFANSCDSLRVAADFCRTDSSKFIYHLRHPLRADKRSVSLLSQQLLACKEEYEKFFRRSINEDEIKNRMQAATQKSNRMRDIYSRLEQISYREYLQALNECHQAPLMQWEESLAREFSPSSGTKRLYLIGPYLHDVSIIEVIENLGGVVVGDNLTNSRRYLLPQELPEGVEQGDVFSQIATRILFRSPSPTMSLFPQTIAGDLAEIEKGRVSGVIFVFQKFCEPYDYIYPLYQKELTDRGIAFLRIQIESTRQQGQELRLQLETFLQGVC